MKIRVLLLAVALSLATPAFAGEDEDVLMSVLKSKYPSTQFTSVTKTAIDGLFEVAMGKTIAYTDKIGNIMVFGHMYDMPGQRDITAERLNALNKIDVKQLPLKNAIKTVKGNGKRTLYVFSDPDCPYCKALEQNLEKLNNVTIYTFLFPLAQLHPEAEAKSVGIWCAKDRAKSWRDYMLNGQPPAAAECKNPIKENVSLGQGLGINGTPSLFNARGEMRAGAMPAEQIEQWIAE